jgi:hypothetical protein
MNAHFCKHLRTKSMYVLASTEEALAEREDGEASTCHYWCNRTQTVTGLDDERVHKTTCKDGRSCFEE